MCLEQGHTPLTVVAGDCNMYLCNTYCFLYIYVDIFIFVTYAMETPVSLENVYLCNMYL